VPGAAIVLLPLGSPAPHGPHLPFDTDTTIASEVARRTADALERDVVLAPPLAYGASGEHQHFPGTLSMGTEALHVVIVELARSLRTWAPRLVIVNGHGGNVPALGDAVHQLVAEGHDAAWVPCGLPGGDAHAGRDETSMMLRLRPQEVAPQRPVGSLEPIGRLMPRLMRDGVRAIAPDGVLGDTRSADAELGERLLSEMTASAVRRIEAASTDDRGCLRDPVPMPA
jgi:creatinine amidohydrolase